MFTAIGLILWTGYFDVLIFTLVADVLRHHRHHLSNRVHEFVSRSRDAGRAFASLLDFIVDLADFRRRHGADRRFLHRDVRSLASRI
ncbi:MAG: hypothetical protein MZU97_20305 [Bacillus subtilis]|nr:hypothetical protein [Bacillus subtilis]